MSALGVEYSLNYRFADDCFNAEEEEEADGIVNSVDTTCTIYKMKIGPDKIKLIKKN